jgi:hypothetical protein
MKRRKLRKRRFEQVAVYSRHGLAGSVQLVMTTASIPLTIAERISNSPTPVSGGLELDTFKTDIVAPTPATRNNRNLPKKLKTPDARSSSRAMASPTNQTMLQLHQVETGSTARDTSTVRYKTRADRQNISFATIFLLRRPSGEAALYH